MIKKNLIFIGLLSLGMLAVSGCAQKMAKSDDAMEPASTQAASESASPDQAAAKAGAESAPGSSTPLGTALQRSLAKPARDAGTGHLVGTLYRQALRRARRCRETRIRRFAGCARQRTLGYDYGESGRTGSGAHRTPRVAGKDQVSLNSRITTRSPLWKTRTQNQAKKIATQH